MLYLLLSAIIVALDQWFKSWIVGYFAAGSGQLTLIPGVFGLTLVHNPGASWGILSGKTDFLLIVTLIVCIGLIAALIMKKPAARLGRLSLAFVLGGAVGNAIDRLLQGYVVDMFETLFVEFPIFNIADCFICIGAGLMILWVILDEVRERKAKQNGNEGEQKHEN